MKKNEYIKKYVHHTRTPNNLYLTEHGFKKVKAFIAECQAKRKEILDAGKDTAASTRVPNVFEIEEDINAMGLDNALNYYNAYAVTDSYNYDLGLALYFGEDITNNMASRFIKTEHLQDTEVYINAYNEKIAFTKQWILAHPEDYDFDTETDNINDTVTWVLEEDAELSLDAYEIVGMYLVNEKENALKCWEENIESLIDELTEKDYRVWDILFSLTLKDKAKTDSQWPTDDAYYTNKFSTVGELITLLEKLPANAAIKPFGSDCLLAISGDHQTVFLDDVNWIKDNFPLTCTL